MINDAEFFSAVSPADWIHVELTRDEAENILQAKKTLLVGLELEQRFDILLENYAALEEYIIMLALRNAIFADDTPKRFSVARHHMSRHLNNFLSCAKLYLDQTAHGLSTLFGKDSTQYEQFQKLTHIEYDSSFEYRVLEGLRSYSQHRGLPTHSVTFASSNDIQRNLIVSRVSFGLSPTTLQNDPKFKKSVLTEIEQNKDEKGKIELMPLIRCYVSCIARIQRAARENMSPEICAADNCVMSLFEKVRLSAGHECASGIVRRVSNNEVRDVTDITNDWIKEREEYIEKNRKAEFIPRIHVSTQ